MSEEITVVEIYAADLTEEALSRIKNQLEIEDVKQLNWDTFPMATIYISLQD